MSPLWTYVTAAVALLLAGVSACVSAAAHSRLLIIEAYFEELLGVHTYPGRCCDDDAGTGRGRHGAQESPDTPA